MTWRTYGKVRSPSPTHRRPSAELSAEWQVMNEVALHRGASPHLNTIDVFVDGQHLTEAVVRAFSLCTLSSFRADTRPV